VDQGVKMGVLEALSLSHHLCRCPPHLVQMVDVALASMVPRVKQVVHLADVAHNMGMFSFQFALFNTFVLTAPSHRFCGLTPAHCGQGCQNGCQNGTPAQGQPPATTSAEPVIGPVTGTTAPNPGATTTDGTCGASNGNTVCGSWPNGNCCSMYGFW
jgi:hypothetical protein